jgi:hypothetical protein
MVPAGAAVATDATDPASTSTTADPSTGEGSTQPSGPVGDTGATDPTNVPDADSGGGTTSPPADTGTSAPASGSGSGSTAPTSPEAPAQSSTPVTGPAEDEGSGQPPVSTTPTSPTAPDGSAGTSPSAPTETETDPGFESYGYVVRGVVGDPEDGGYAEVGRQLSIAPASGQEDPHVVYRWSVGDRDSVAGKTYLPGPEDVGLRVTVLVDAGPMSETPIFVAGTTKPAPVPTPPAQPGTPTTPTDPGSPTTPTQPELPADPDPVVEGTLPVTGTSDGHAVVGQALTVTHEDWQEGAAFAHRWTVGGSLRSDTATYTPRGADLDQHVTLTTTVTLAGHEDVVRVQHLYVLATPTVTVKAPTVTAGQPATVSVVIVGPQGAPPVLPTGSVKITLTSRDGRSEYAGPVAVDHGVATFSVPGLSAGTWDITAWYDPQPMHWFFLRSDVHLLGGYASPYLPATGTGSVRVEGVVPVLSAPASIAVPVATRAVLQADVVAQGVPVGSTWTVREGRTVLASGEVRKGGQIAATLPVLAAGTHTLVLEVAATPWTTAVARTVTVVVAGEPVQVGGTPTAELDSPKSATAPGQQMELVAEGFEPGETVAFYLHSDPVYLGTAVADANGVARLMAWVPADVPVGAHTVIATGGVSGRWATLAVELAAAAAPAAAPVAAPVAPAPVAVPVAAAPAGVTPAATGELAVTGAGSDALLTGAWLMVLLGGGLVLVARRVRALR